MNTIMNETNRINKGITTLSNEWNRYRNGVLLFDLDGIKFKKIQSVSYSEEVNGYYEELNDWLAENRNRKLEFITPRNFVAKLNNQLVKRKLTITHFEIEESKKRFEIDILCKDLNGKSVPIELKITKSKNHYSNYLFTGEKQIINILSKSKYKYGYVFLYRTFEEDYKEDMFMTLKVDEKSKQTYWQRRRIHTRKYL